MRLRREHRRRALLLAVVALVVTVGGGCANGAVPNAGEEAPAPGRAETGVPSPDPNGETESPTPTSPADPGPRGEVQATASEPAPTEPAETDEADPVGAPTNTPEPSKPAEPTAAVAAALPTDAGFPAGSFLFIEIVEQRVTKSDTPGQTTSFAGEQTSYSFDPVARALSGALEGTPVGDMPVIVGRIVVTQIDRSKASAGQLYALTQASQAFGTVVVEGVSCDGSVVVSVDGDRFTLAPGESVLMRLDAGGGDDRLAAGATGRTVTVTNHGFLLTENLSVTAP